MKKHEMKKDMKMKDGKKMGARPDGTKMMGKSTESSRIKSEKPAKKESKSGKLKMGC